MICDSRRGWHFRVSNPFERPNEPTHPLNLPANSWVVIRAIGGPLSERNGQNPLKSWIYRKVLDVVLVGSVPMTQKNRLRAKTVNNQLLWVTHSLLVLVVAARSKRYERSGG